MKSLFKLFRYGEFVNPANRALIRARSKIGCEGEAGGTRPSPRLSSPCPVCDGVDGSWGVGETGMGGFMRASSLAEKFLGAHRTFACLGHVTCDDLSGLGWRVLTFDARRQEEHPILETHQQRIVSREHHTHLGIVREGPKHPQKVVAREQGTHLANRFDLEAENAAD